MLDPGKAQSKDLNYICDNLGAGIGRSSFFYFYAGSRLRFGRWIFKVCRKQRILLCTLLWMGEACLGTFLGKEYMGMIIGLALLLLANAVFVILFLTFPRNIVEQAVRDAEEISNYVLG